MHVTRQNTLHALDYETNAVRDITWLSGQPVHLAKWMHALEQVTDGHLVKMYQISYVHERHLPKCHTWALSQLILTEMYLGIR